MPVSLKFTIIVYFIQIDKFNISELYVKSQLRPT